MKYTNCGMCDKTLTEDEISLDMKHKITNFGKDGKILAEYEYLLCLGCGSNFLNLAQEYEELFLDDNDDDDD